MTKNEIARTAFEFSGNGDNNCPYCKNAETEVMRSPAELRPFIDFYQGKVEKFTVVSCFCCDAVWSFYEKYRDT